MTSPQLLDDPRAPELFVSKVTGCALTGDNAHITFAAARRNADHSDIALIVNLRIVMPLSSFKDSLAFMQAAVELKENSK